MACPYFFPISRHEGELWPHRRRLPLGDGFAGHCMATGYRESPSDAELKDCCNLGYASSCTHLPAERLADAVHFCIGGDRDGVVTICWVMVKNHGAAGNGNLEFDRAVGRWISRHPEPNVQQMALCYLKSYFSKRGEEVSLIS